jgi:predicted aconitase
MLLTDEEERMLAGEYGPGMQRAIDVMVKLGESADAEKLVPISYGHISYEICQEDFWDLMTEGITSTPHLVTTHCLYQPELWQEWGLPLAENWIGEHNRKLKKVKQLGWLRSDTCAAYLIGIIPRKGDVVSMGGTCMQVSNNSLFGARVDRMGMLVSLAAGICGRTPLMGLVMPENRYARYVVELDNLDVTDWTCSHYHCLGYYIADQLPGFKPVAVNGLPPNLSLEFTRSIVISMPTSGAITLAHVVGTTPEAPTLEAALGNKKPEQVISVGRDEMRQTWERLNIWDDNSVEHVVFGCPHATISELGQIAALLEGRAIKASMVIGAALPVEALARHQGYAGIIEKAGGHILPLCASVHNPFARPDIAGDKQVKSAATNSARAAHYLAALGGIKVFFGTTEECIDAAISGRWKGEMPQWK